MVSVATHAEDNDSVNGKLRFAVVSVDEPPFIYTNSSNEYKGILPSLAKALGRYLNLEVEYVPTPRKGLEQGIITGNADLTWLSPSWVENKQQLIFSDSIFLHREFLYSLSPFTESEHPPDWVKGKTICIRQDYSYPSLSSFFSKNIAQAVDVSSQVPLLKLLLKNRCDLLYMNEHRAHWMINRLGIKRQIWRSPTPLETNSLTLILDKNWQSEMSKINQALDNIKRSGELGSIIQTYTHPIALSRLAVE